MSPRPQLAYCVLLIMLLPSYSGGQTPSVASSPAAKASAMAAKLPHYDVASVKINQSGDPNWQVKTADSLYVAKNAPLLGILQSAYNIFNGNMISGLSGPVASARFDIEAKLLGANGAPPPKLTDEQLEAMIIPVLTDRFHFHATLKPKVMEVYELVVAKGGPKMKLTMPESDDGSLGMRFSETSNILTAKKTSISHLADALSEGVLHRVVLDRTGLKGEADFALKWSSDSAEEKGIPDTVSIFTAIQEQLGLKLIPAKAPVDTLVIDHVEMPTPN